MLLINSIVIASSHTETTINPTERIKVPVIILIKYIIIYSIDYLHIEIILKFHFFHNVNKNKPLGRNQCQNFPIDFNDVDHLYPENVIWLLKENRLFHYICMLTSTSHITIDDMTMIDYVVIFKFGLCRTLSAHINLLDCCI